MSIIFGLHIRSPRAVRDEELESISVRTRRFVHDGVAFRKCGQLGMGLQVFHTHERSVLHESPESDECGNVITFDGRLDNYVELQKSLGIPATQIISDAGLVLSAFRKWGAECYGKLVGDWALALWSALDRVIYLARDHAGTRTLYFSSDGEGLKWSTDLESFVSASASSRPDTNYLLRYISGKPVDTLTPYQAVEAVAPAQYVAFSSERVKTAYHWHCSEQLPATGMSEDDYLAQFLMLFGQSVKRRTVPGAKIVAQLSGGMDSSSIVCMSDHLRRVTDQNAPLLDTISYLNDEEPHSNERPFVSAVETQRSKSGLHVRANSFERTFLPAMSELGTYLFPGADSSTIAKDHVLNAAISQQGYRVILSGIGGDEVLGGVPEPRPELATLMTSGALRTFTLRNIEWCLHKRDTFLHLLYDTVTFTAKLYLAPDSLQSTSRPAWLRGPNNSSLHKSTDIKRYIRGVRTHHPQAMCNRLAWRAALTTLPSLTPGLFSREEFRYPFLDRDLVDFAHNIPRNLLVRPGRRRYLMRKAMAGILPLEVIERKRKGFISASPLRALRAAKDSSRTALHGSLCAELGIVDRHKFTDALDLVLRGEEVDDLIPILRTLHVELWLQARFGEAFNDTECRTATDLRLSLGAQETRNAIV